MASLPLLFIVGVGIIAFLYSFVGHGGASGYLALLALSGLAPKEIQVLALCLNLVVASTSFGFFSYARHLDWRLTWPFLIGSLPFAFIGSSIKLSDPVFFSLVGVTLVIAAVRMLMLNSPNSIFETKPLPPVWAGIGIGSIVGLASGLVGVGGGIFLSPILLLTKWADAKRTAATSAIFIVANSLVGLGTRITHGAHFPSVTPMLCIVGLAGALAGSQLGAFRAPSQAIRTCLGVVLMLAAIKLISG